MHGHTNVEGEGPIVQHIDAEENYGDECPSVDGHLRHADGVLSLRRELARICGKCREGELKECYEQALRSINSWSRYTEGGIFSGVTHRFLARS